MFGCIFKSDIPKYAGKNYVVAGMQRRPFSLSTNFKFPIVQEIDIDRITEPSDEYIPSKHKTIVQSTLRIIHLENVDYFKVENCNTTKTLFRMLFYITKRSKGIVKDINLTECVVSTVLGVEDSKVDIINVKINHLVTLKIYYDGWGTSNIYMRRSKVNMNSLQIKNSEMFSWFIWQRSTQLTLNDLTITQTEFKEIIIEMVDVTSNFSNIFLKKVKCHKNFIDSLKWSNYNCLRINNLKIIDSNFKEGHAVFYFTTRTIVKLEQVQIKNSNNVSALFKVLGGSSLTMVNISISNMKHLQAMFTISSKHKMQIIHGLKIRNCSSVENIFKLSNGNRNITNVEIIDTISQNLMFSTYSDIWLKGFKVTSSLFTNNMMHFEGEEDQKVKLVASEIKTENTTVINNGLLIKHGNITVNNFKLVKTKLGNILHATKSGLILREVDIHQTKVQNVFSKSKASFNAFVLVESSKILLQKSRIRECSIDENMFFFCNPKKHP